VVLRNAVRAGLDRLGASFSARRGSKCKSKTATKTLGTDPARERLKAAFKRLPARAQQQSIASYFAGEPIDLSELEGEFDGDDEGPAE
jgi:hypothetical protein